jgi:hypothetical protein
MPGTVIQDMDPSQHSLVLCHDSHFARTLAYSPGQAIKTGTSSNLPIHNQAWAYQGTTSKQDQGFLKLIQFERHQVSTRAALPGLISQRILQARYELTSELGKAKTRQRQKKDQGGCQNTNHCSKGLGAGHCARDESHIEAS